MGKLENKTKAQLIEIIMRKDDVENELREKIEEHKEGYDQLYAEHKELLKDRDAIKEELDSIKSDYEAMCDDTVTKNAQKMEDYEKLLGDYNTLKKSYNHAIKDCQGTSRTAEARAEKIISLEKELAECKKVRDTWVVTAVVAVLIACVVCVL